MIRSRRQFILWVQDLVAGVDELEEEHGSGPNCQVITVSLHINSPVSYYFQTVDATRKKL